MCTELIRSQRSCYSLDIVYRYAHDFKISSLLCFEVHDIRIELLFSWHWSPLLIHDNILKSLLTSVAYCVEKEHHAYTI